jgi:hypothetical protein
MITLTSLRIDEVTRGPKFIVEGPPNGIVAIDGDRYPIFKSETAAGTLLTLRSNATRRRR